MRRTILVGVLALAIAACGFDEDEDVATVGLAAETPLPRRDGTIVVDGCVIDTWQRSTLAQPSTRRVARDLVFLCLVPRLDGVVGPRDPGALGFLREQLGELRRDGYRVSFGVSFTDESGVRYDGAQTAAQLADPRFRTNVANGMREVADLVDGFEIDLLGLPSGARADVTALVKEARTAVTPKRLAIFVPPSISTPSDLPGGDAFDIAALAPFVDRFHVSTLDYSEPNPGPTLDSGWAVDAVRHARAKAGATPLDISMPLYGTDFGPRGLRSVTWLEATAKAAEKRARVERGPSGAPFFRWVDQGQPHETWFDDAFSTGLALGAWSYDVLPPDVGVVFYGLGAEEPALWDRLAERTP